MSGLLAWHRRTGYRYWGESRQAREARAAELRALTTEPVREFEALPVVSPNPMGAFSLHTKPSRATDARGRSVDALLEKYGRRR